MITLWKYQYIPLALLRSPNTLPPPPRPQEKPTPLIIFGPIQIEKGCLQLFCSIFVLLVGQLKNSSIILNRQGDLGCKLLTNKALLGG